MSSKQKRLCIGVLLACLMLSLVPQIAAQRQVEIQLIDESILRGPVFESTDSLGVSVSIEGQEILIPHERISYIQFINKKKKVKLRDNIIWTVKKGYYHSFAMGLSFGSSIPGLSMGLINGYQWNKHLGSGLGLGYEMMEDIYTIPLFLELKGYLKRGKVVPIYFVRPGYGFIQDSETFAENSSERGGMYWHAGVGYQFNFESASLVFSLGHMGQDATVSYSFPDWSTGDDTHVTERRMKRRIAFRVGVTF